MRVDVLIVLAGLSGCMTPELSNATLAARAKASAQDVGGVLSDVDAGDTGVGADLASDQLALDDAAEDNMVTDAGTADAATDVASSSADADSLTADSAPGTPDAVAIDSAPAFHVTGGILVVPTRKNTAEFGVRGEGLLDKRACGQGLCAIGGIKP